MVRVDVLKNRLIILCCLATFWSLPFIPLTNACPPGCTCTTLKPKDEEESSGFAPHVGLGRKVDCSNPPAPISSIAHISRPSLPLDTVQLDLSKNEITAVQKGALIQLSMLQKLDLSDNKISLIEPGAFEGLQKLQRLDLSNNKIGSINSSVFAGLLSLEKLSLSNNRINTIPEGAFNDLSKLKRIDFKSGYLRCDCHLQWIVKWAKSKNVRIQQSTTCAVPRELKDRPLKSLKTKSLHCEWPLELPLFEITPMQRQIVFEGDKLPFECQASVIDPQATMVWMRKGSVVKTNRSAGIFVHTATSLDRTVMTHRLVLENLAHSHEGTWDCMVFTSRGNVSDSIDIVVMSNSAKHCPEHTVKTNKGVYTWFRTVAGVKIEQRCKVGKKNMASFQCTNGGSWDDLDVESCAFTNELTRKLENLAFKMWNETKIHRFASDFQAQISKPDKILDAMDIVFAAKIIEKLSSYVRMGYDQVTESILGAASALMQVSEKILLQAQLKDQACARMVKAVESIPAQLQQVTEYRKYYENIAMEIMSLPVYAFPGVACFVYVLHLGNIPVFDSSAFRCKRGVFNQTALLRTKQARVQASIQLPKSLLTSNSTILDPTNEAENTLVQFIIYREPKLFPLNSNNVNDAVLRQGTWKVVSCVLSGGIDVPEINLTDPVVLTFEVPPTQKRLAAAYWDFQANGGLGDWRTDGCSVVGHNYNVTIAHCYRLSIFAILQLEDQKVEMETMFHMMEAVIYVGSCVCIICLMAIIITYVSCYRFINVPKKMKHSVINISISVLLLIITFTMGIKRNDHIRACQVVGVAIHYFTLCAIFWITITSNNMLKKFTKAERPPSPPPEPLLMPMPPKPMLRFYLLGWGVPIIICGITAAVDINHYMEPEYCFLSWDPSLGAFYGPVVLLVVLNLIFFMRISCIIRGSTNSLNNTDERDELPVNDIELTQNPDDINIETRSQRSDESGVSTVSSILDQERRPITQLRALVATMFLYIVMWVCGALAVAQPFKTIIPHQVLIFSYLYGINSAVLGIFMLIYYCLSRQDSRSSWRRFFYCEQQTVHNISAGLVTQMPHANGHVIHSSNQLEETNTENKNSPPNNVKNSSHKKHENKNQNLVPQSNASHTDGSGTGSVPENKQSFYNSRQNGVAKKFWDKTRHSSKLISNEINRELHSSGNFSNSENLSGSEKHQMSGHGNDSDANTHFSIEIQIQTNPQEKEKMPVPKYTPSSQSYLPPSYDELTLYPVESPVRSQISPVSGVLSSDQGPENVSCTSVSQSYSQDLPRHTRSPSSSSLGTRSHPSAFTPVSPRNNTLPKQNKPHMAVSPSPPNYYMNRNGQSQVSDNCSRERLQTPTKDIYNVAGYPHCHQLSNINHKQPNVYKQYGLIDGQTSCETFGNVSYGRSRTSLGGFTSDSSNNHNKDNNFVQEVEERIPQNPPAHSPSMSDNQNYDYKRIAPDSDSQLLYKRRRTNDSDHNSEPTSQTHWRKCRSHDGHRHSKLKGSSRDQWDRVCGDRPRVIPYAYVNHMYKERVMQKLLNNAVSENIEPESKAFWLPRSSSDFERVAHEESKHMVEDSSSSSEDNDDSLDNIWILQEKEREKKKKETSV